MRRTEALAPLSRDHHQALAQALKLKRATPAEAADIARGLLTFWDHHGARHFQVEEEVLLPAYARYADPEQDAVVRVLVDHVWIRSRIDRLRGADEPSPRHLRELGERLDAHVRHEERVLFPLIEDAMPEPEIDELAASVERAERAG
ncbi:MAG TPA: hemerythrin domain-containing protein [Solirubrobacterales bacterium]|nr:hemerythrin domain-containing protein [Solirubrobacterales bacterium]